MSDTQMYNIQDIMLMMYELERSKVPEGKTWFIDLHIRPSDKLIHLDFVRGDKNDGSKNVPLTRDGVNVEYPNREVREIRVSNRGGTGAGATAVFSVNVEGRNSTRATTRVGLYDSQPFSMWGFPVLRNMNIVLETGSTENANIEILLIA